MEILLHKDIIIGYIYSNTGNDSWEDSIEKILSNKNSKFLFSNKFFNFIKNEIDDEKLPFFKALYTKFNYVGEAVDTPETATDFDEEFINIYQHSRSNIIISITLNHPTEDIIKQIPNIAVISECEKPNYHWMITQLAVNHPNKVTVKWYDFDECKKIQSFFDNIFKIPKSISYVNIFDRQKNFGHTRFDSIRNSCKVNFYTFYFHSTYYQDEILIKKFFRMCRIFTTNNKYVAHGRRVIFDSIIINTDTDFHNLHNPGDWFIDVQISPSEEAEWLSIRRHYR